MMKVDRVLWRIRDMSRIVTSFVMLRKKNPRLLLIMLGILPVRIIWVRRKRRLFRAPLYPKNRTFAKTGSGQT